GSDRGALRGVPSLAGLPMPKALALGLPPFRGEHALPASCLGVVSPTPFEDDETRPAVRRHARQRRPDLLRRWCRDWSFVLDLESDRGLAFGHGAPSDKIDSTPFLPAGGQPQGLRTSSPSCGKDLHHE